MIPIIFNIVIRRFWFAAHFQFVAMAALLAYLMLPSSDANAQFALVRDSEIENFLQDLSAPVFAAANYKRGQIKFYLISDESINAFVTGGDKIFIHTGLISQAKSPEEIVSVIAHEMGHIIAGHVGQSLQSQQRASKIALSTALTALAVGLATSNIDAAIVGSLGGSDTAQKGFLKGSRLREVAADQIAVDLLNRAEISPRHMADFFTLLAAREEGANYDKYLLSHPLSKDRLNFIKHQTEISDYKNQTERAAFVGIHQRIKLKIIAHTGRVGDLLTHYNSDRGGDIYVRAIAHHRNLDTKQASKLIGILIKQNPNDPYLYELQGEILHRGNDYDGAIASYRKTLKLLGKAPLIDFYLATTLADKVFTKPGISKNTLSDEDKRIFKQAQIHAYRALNGDENIIASWKLLGRIHDSMNQAGRRDLALAEYAFGRGNIAEAEKLAHASKKQFEAGDSGIIRVQDILLQIENIKKQNQP